MLKLTNEKDSQSADTEPNSFESSEDLSLQDAKSLRVVHTVSNLGTGAKFLIFCPGCNCCHGWNDRWGFDGNMDSPTVSPSLLVTHLPNYKQSPELTYDGVCHSFIRNGNISFLSDSTHKLAGQTVKLEPF